MSHLAHRPWNAWRVARWSVAATLLAIPAVMMQVPGSGFDWSVGDFVFARAMIVGTALLYEWLATRSGDAFFRAGAVAALAAAAAFAAALRPAGMARAMLAAAGFQLLVTALAASDGWGVNEPPGATGVLALNLGFAALWLLSAGLFWKSARRAA